MTQPSMLARMVALVGDAAIAWRRIQGPVPEQAVGTAPAIPTARDERESYDRPVGVAIGPDRASLLVADDAGDVIWRVVGA